MTILSGFLVLNSLEFLDVDLSPIYDCEARGVETEASRYGGVDEASSTPGCAAAASETIHSVQVGCDERSQ